MCFEVEDRVTVLKTNTPFPNHPLNFLRHDRARANPPVSLSSTVYALAHSRGLGRAARGGKGVSVCQVPVQVRGLIASVSVSHGVC